MGWKEEEIVKTETKEEEGGEKGEGLVRESVFLGGGEGGGGGQHNVSIFIMYFLGHKPIKVDLVTGCCHISPMSLMILLRVISKYRDRLLEI